MPELACSCAVGVRVKAGTRFEDGVETCNRCDRPLRGHKKDGSGAGLTHRPIEAEVSAEEAIAAAEAIERNVKAGLMPTTGGAVSLMSVRQVDMIYDSNSGRDAGFVPGVPDADGRPARDRSEWYVAAIEQALLHGDAPFSTAHLDEMDAHLSDYRGRGVNWARIYSYAFNEDSTVAPMQDPRYWTRSAEPLSVMAFCGEALRARIYSEPVASVFSQPEDNPGTPESTEGRLGALEKSNRRLRILLLSALVGTLVLVAITFASARHWTKVDVSERSETYETGKFVVTDNRIDPCYVDQSWIGCINEMSDEYNNACTEGGGLSAFNKSTLTAASRRVCDEYLTEIKRMKRGATPGDLVASLGDYGHLQRTPETSTRKIPAVTHEAVCYLGFIGECD